MSQEVRRRRYKPKSRGGCITCKARRVKCGEERPICIRCAKYGVDCEGYEPYQSAVLQTNHRPLVSKVASPFSGSSVKDTETLGRPLLPRDTSNTLTERRLLRSSASARASDNTSDTAQSGERVDLEQSGYQALMPAPFSSRFQTQEDYDFHRFFRMEVADTLAASSPSILWHQVMLQAAEQEPYILDALLAVSALHKIIVSAPDTRTPEALRHSKDNHYFALRKYQRSLASMRMAISDGRMDARNALIACVLTICFENACGRRDTAIANCLAGSRLRQQFAIPSLSGTSSSPRALTRGSTQSSPVEAELVIMFTRLDICSMALVDMRSLDEHRVMKDELDEVADDIPFLFYTLSKATSYCNVIMSRCWHFMKIIQGMKRKSTDRPMGHRHDDDWLFSESSYGLNPWTGTHAKVPDQWVQEADRCATQLEKWLSAFEPLWLKYTSCTEPFSDDYFRAVLLRFEAKSTLVSVRGSIYTQEVQWDKHLPEFKEIISLAETFLAAKWKPGYMSFDSETIIYLHYASWKCRDGATRRRILKGMEDYPRRESVYDSRNSLINGNWLMEMEEGDKGEVECHQITEEERMRVIGLDFNIVDGRVFIWGCRQVDGQWKYEKVECWGI